MTPKNISPEPEWLRQAFKTPPKELHVVTITTVVPGWPPDGCALALEQMLRAEREGE